MGLIDEKKTEGRKSRVTVPLNSHNKGKISSVAEIDSLIHAV
jgi:hypothetical protein